MSASPVTAAVAAPVDAIPRNVSGETVDEPEGPGSDEPVFSASAGANFESHQDDVPGGASENMFQSKAGRSKDKADRATSDQVMDQSTRMIILGMINRGVFDEMHGAISTGKEANVYNAVAVQNGVSVQLAVKIYKTAILAFKDREKYVSVADENDSRPKPLYNKGNSRLMVKVWAEKEYRSLKRIFGAGIACPEPITLTDNVLVMRLLGDQRGWAFPQLRNAPLEGEDVDDQWRRLYIQLTGIMRRLYKVCRLVHADLSEYNILYHEGTLYIIDVSQSVGYEHPCALVFLRMDIKNVGDFFRRKRVDTLSDRTVFEFITAGEGPVEEPAMSEIIERLYEIRTAEPDEDDDFKNAAAEVDTAVFRNQYIPRTLNEVANMEYDVEKINSGEGGDLIYKRLLAHLDNDEDIMRATKPQLDESASSRGSDSISDDTATGDESLFQPRTPRGRKHQDKDEKKLHKMAVKEEKKEKRKEKIPKAVKKRAVQGTRNKRRTG